MKLVNIKETYDVVYKDKNVAKEKQAVFILRRLSASEVNSIDDEITVSKGDASFAYLGGTASRMKIDIALVDWKNIENDDGKEVPCNGSAKELLPSIVQQFLVKRIDEDNGLVKSKKKEQDEKN